MGKAEVTIVRVPRVVTVAALVALTAAMAALIYYLTGRAYLHEHTSLVDIIAIIRRYDVGGESPTSLIANFAPVMTNILFFIPWGALAFLSFDRARWPRIVTYLVTLAVGAAFASVLVAWQTQLPTRVTGWTDAEWNLVGVLIGAIGGHLRKRVRVRFAAR